MHIASPRAGTGNDNCLVSPLLRYGIRDLLNVVVVIQLAVEYGDRVRFLKIDTDEEHELANQMQVRSSKPQDELKHPSPKAVVSQIRVRNFVAKEK